MQISINNISGGPFKSFNSSISFDNKVNVVLGWNGTGKTIISRIFRAVENEKLHESFVEKSIKFNINIDSSPINQENVTGNSNKTIVFNEDYIKETIGGYDLDHIVVLGKDFVDKSHLEIEREKVKKQFNEIDINHKPQDILASKCAKDIKNITGIKEIKKEYEQGTYSEYTKSSFEKLIDNDFKLLDQNNKTAFKKYILEDDEYSGLVDSLSNNAKKQDDYKNLCDAIKLIKSIENDLKSTLSFQPKYEKSKRLEQFQNNSKEIDWIREGVALHKLNENDFNPTCLFCNSKILNIKELLLHFSKDVLELDKKIKYLESTIEKITSILNINYKYYLEYHKSIFDYVENCSHCLNSKKNNILNHIHINDFNIELPEDVFELIPIARKIERHHVAEVYEEYLKQVHEFTEKIEKHDEYKKLLIKLKISIKEIELNNKKAYIPAEKINRAFKSAFPLKDISLEYSDKNNNKYEIFRDGNPCNLDSFSEGERNYLALIYFLFSLEDENKKIDDKALIVIDDPVSSLDSTSLFHIFSVIKASIDIYKNKFIIFTHNLEFFSLIQKNLTSRNEISFYNLFTDYESSKIERFDKDTLLNISDYHYSISELNKIANNYKHKYNAYAANLLRKVIESFCNFKYGYSKNINTRLDELFKDYESKLLDKDSIGSILLDSEKYALYKFINVGSHKFPNIEYPDSFSSKNGQKFIKHFFEIVRVVDCKHYKTLKIVKNN